MFQREIISLKLIFTVHRRTHHPLEFKKKRIKLEHMNMESSCHYLLQKPFLVYTYLYPPTLTQVMKTIDMVEKRVSGNLCSHFLHIEQTFTLLLTNLCLWFILKKQIISMNMLLKKQTLMRFLKLPSFLTMTKSFYQLSVKIQKSVNLSFLWFHIETKK